MKLDESGMLAFVASCDDPEKLRAIEENARKRGAETLVDAAFRRRVSILPSERPGTVEHGFWRSVHALEAVLTEERGRKTRLSRTRQKVDRVGVRRVLADWALDQEKTDGFDLFEIADGQPCSWCEMKAVKGSLQDRPVGLSRTQFEWARERGANYWLDVAELG